MNGTGNGSSNSNEKDKEKDDISQPSTSTAGMTDEPKWNTSTRQLYEGNLKSSGMAPQNSLLNDKVHRERIPSIAESTSSDDSCVYMYKGDNENRNGADGVVGKAVSCSSPEMDYLEMDFDPCQSNGQDSSDGSYNCENVDLREENPENDGNNADGCPSPCVFDKNNSPCNSLTNETTNDHEFKEPIHSTSNCEDPQDVPDVVQVNSQESVEPLEKVDCEKQLDEAPEFCQRNVLMKHITEASRSNCCISSVFDALNAVSNKFGREIYEEISEDAVLNRDFCNEELCVVDFLLSVSSGGLTVPSLINTIEKVSDGSITAKYFFAQSSKKINLSSWLQYWLKKGAVPLLSLNFHLIEDDCSSSVNSSWHFQVVHDIGQKGIQLFSPFDCVSEEIILRLLHNPSEILISRDEILNRWSPYSDLRPLMTTPDHLWKKYNVLGQVVNVIREGVTGRSDDEIKFITVPSCHRTGVLLLIHVDNPNRRELLEINDFIVLEDIC